MKRVLLLAAFLLTLAAVSATAFAQPGPDGQRGQRGGQRDRGPGGPGGFGGFGNLLENAKVKEELKLSDDQVAQLKKVAEESRPPRRDRGQGNGENPPAPPTREDFEKRINERQAKINKILTPEQQTQYTTLQFQIGGGLDSPFLGARNLEVLKLTDDQKAKIKVIEDQRREKMLTAFQSFRDLSPEDRTKRGQELEAAGKEFATQIKAVLTPEQLAQGEKLTAEAKTVREKLGLPAPGQRNGGDRGNRRDGERQRGEGYRPNAGSWQPGQGTQGQPQEGDAPKRQFPRSEN